MDDVMQGRALVCCSAPVEYRAFFAQGNFKICALYSL